MIPKWALFLTDSGWSISLRPFNPLALTILAIPLVLLRRRGKSAGYLLCFSLFFLYLWAVCNYAVCPLPIDSDLIEWMRGVQTWDERVNLMPRLFLRLPEYWHDASFYSNIVLGVPFGLGLPFVVPTKYRAATWAVGLGFAFAAGLELIQLGISILFYGFPYRSIDIEDVVLVFVGTLFGYGIYRAGAAIYRRLGWAGAARLPVWDHFHAVLLSAAAEASQARARPTSNP